MKRLGCLVAFLSSASASAGYINLPLSGGGGSGTVTGVTATAPIQSSGGTAPVISCIAASGSVAGCLSAADWTTFNNKGSGTVTTASVASANGFAGSIANPTTTPAITISTSITGLLKGNGTAISAATSGTDYAPAQGGLYKAYMGNGSSTIHWDVTSATKADFVATGAPALTQTYNFNMGSPALPTGSLPGVTFTAPATGTVFVQISTASGILVANNGHFYLTDGSGNVLDAATVHETAANAPASVVLSAYFDVTASSSYTFKLMAAAPSGAVSLGASSTMTNLLSVSVGYVK